MTNRRYRRTGARTTLGLVSATLSKFGILKRLHLGDDPVVQLRRLFFIGTLVVILVTRMLAHGVEAARDDRLPVRVPGPARVMDAPDPEARPKVADL